MPKVKVATTDQLSDGQTTRLDVGDTAVLLSKLDGQFYAIDAVCSHKGGALEDGLVNGCLVRCPLHEAVFDLRSGKVASDTPWAEDQTCFPVSVVGTDVFVTVEGAEHAAHAQPAGSPAPTGTSHELVFNPMSDEHLANPYPTFAQARRKCPVFHNPAVNLWGVARYDDLWTALKDPGRFSSAMSSTAGTGPSPEMLEVLNEGYPEVNTLVTNDPPSHTRFRALVNKAFTPSKVAGREAHVREVANALVDSFVGDGEVDVVWRFAYPLPMRLIAEFLGVPREDMDTFKKWSDDSVARLSVIPVERQIECAHSIVEFQHYFAAKIEERRREPRDDMLTELVNARLDGVAPLTVPELLSVLQQLLVAGNETTTNLIGNMTYLLLTHPDQWQAVKDDRSLAANAVEEALRMEPPVQGLFRTTTTDAALSGVEIPRGAHVQLLYASGNRDEFEFPDPDRFDVRRANARTHLAFGGGIHFCIGAPLARLEGRVALETLLDRLPNLRLHPTREHKRPAHFFLRGFEHLYLQWDVP